MHPCQEAGTLEPPPLSQLPGALVPICLGARISPEVGFGNSHTLYLRAGEPARKKGQCGKTEDGGPFVLCSPASTTSHINSGHLCGFLGTTRACPASPTEGQYASAKCFYANQNRLFFPNDFFLAHFFLAHHSRREEKNAVIPNENTPQPSLQGSLACFLCIRYPWPVMELWPLGFVVSCRARWEGVRVESVHLQPDSSTLQSRSCNSP